jgi:long-chain acyl-CoA synthetase
MTFISSMHSALDRFRDRIVLMQGAQTWSYGDLSGEYEQCRIALRAAGARTGDTVVAQLPSGLSFLAMMLAAPAEGLCLAPVSNTLPAKRINQIIENLKPRLMAQLGADGAMQVTALEPDTEPIPRQGFIRYTSGTTGEAKGVVVSLDAALFRATSAREGLDLPVGVRVLWPMEMALHFVSMPPAVLLAGGSFVLPAGPTVADLKEAIELNRPELFYGAPMHIRALAHYRPRPHSLRQVLVTTEALDSTAAEQFKKNWGTPAQRLYGIFEAGLIAFESKSQSGVLSKIFPGIDIQIGTVLKEGASAGVSDVIQIRSPGLLSGYVTPSRDRDDVLQDGWFNTGDIGKILPTGALAILGRSSAVVNVGGAKVFPEEVEQALCSAPGVIAARAFGVVHETLGSVIHAEVVLAADAEFDETALRRICRDMLERYAVPQRIVRVAQVPRTENGKIRREAPGVGVVCER